MNKKCCCCKSSNIRLIGKIPDTNFFAGRQLAENLDGGNLYECRKCGFHFKYPRLPKQMLDQLYMLGDDKIWESSISERKDWQIAFQWLSSIEDKVNVLDVGCSNGDFLNNLPPQFKRYGIEINEKAAMVAKQKGVNIIGSDLAKLGKVFSKFNLVVSFDVIEHTVNPLSYLKSLAELVVPGGNLIISTGNASALSRRFMGSAYWYCVNAEHISFINPKWIDFAARHNRLEIEKITCFSHGAKGSFTKNYFLEGFKNFCYKISPQAFSWLRIKGFGKRTVVGSESLKYFPPSWMNARDHFIVLLRKN